MGGQEPLSIRSGHPVSTQWWTCGLWAAAQQCQAETGPSDTAQRESKAVWKEQPVKVLATYETWAKGVGGERRLREEGV